MAPSPRLHELLERSARAHPDATAVEDPATESAISYSRLDERSSTLRDALVRHGVVPGDRIGIYAPKSIGTVTAIFGILKAGCAYVPVDPGAPPKRNAYIFRDCAVKAVVVAADLADGLRRAGDWTLPVLEELGELEEFGAALLLLDGSIGTGSGDVTAPGVDDLAYVLYTSGSTGQPKGVVHTNASALSFVDWCSEVFQPSADDRFSSHAPFHFDLSILDIYVPIKHGAALILLGEEIGKQPQALAPLIAQRRITVWYSTPSILRLLTEFGKMAGHDYSALRFVLFAGEVFPVNHLRGLQALWPAPRYFNLYGPTETNVCTYFEVPRQIPAERTESFPIGKTCSNDRGRVVDETAMDVPRGEEGELIITGGSVMREYWNLPERTARCFYIDETGARWYRTGDIVREEDDGNLVFIGRRDRMVKRRGYRVELGEIEAALNRHPSIIEAAVVALTDEGGGVVIKAYLAGRIGDRSPSLIELKRFCAENLPLYMVPDRFSFHTSLPKTSTDKVDYQALVGLA